MDTDSLRLWDNLHAQPRFRPRYPNEHVVRFLVRNFAEADRARLQALDIGVGGGRHTKLLCDLGFQTSGIDFSREGLKHCQAWLESEHQQAVLKHATFEALPFPDASFDAVVVYGVYNYGNERAMRQGIAELHRTLKLGGRAFVMVRTTADYRHGKGECLEPDTFRLSIADTNELGTVQHFLSERAVPEAFGAFAEVAFEKTETTFDQRRAVNSDWLIEVRK
jgi:ubiquinone/menaquinone biosynthesis C-methylase UbiE